MAAIALANTRQNGLFLCAVTTAVRPKIGQLWPKMRVKRAGAARALDTVDLKGGIEKRRPAKRVVPSRDDDAESLKRWWSES